MKVTYHIPTEQYGFVEIETNQDPEEGVIERYDALKRPQNAPGSVLDTKTFNGCLDRYLVENVMDSNLYQAMSPEQKNVCQEIKKSFARIKAKEPQELRVRN